MAVSGYLWLRMMVVACSTVWRVVAPARTSVIGYGKNNFSIAILKASDCWKRYDLHWSSLQLLSAYARLCTWRFSFPEDAFHIPGKIESTVGLFPDEDVTLHHPQIGDCCEDEQKGQEVKNVKRVLGARNISFNYTGRDNMSDF
ncbi:hypothetical protein F2Q69_00014639 [Brassica cretica]|uniref:Uncharacterized protein n=1 Tax=Brassica cretica TaxID=69181 RepID=A0A8S9R6N9_BRACR|nr:hypothetical protein F2Q69_00014639 [Brassica cretica]